MTDPLEELLSTLDLPDPVDVVDLTTLPRLSLLRLLSQVSAALADRSETLIATTDDGRRLQSSRDAIRVILKTSKPERHDSP